LNCAITRKIHLAKGITLQQKEILELIQNHEDFKPCFTLKVDGKPLVYNIPNKTAYWRAQTLMTKEPCTITWLNNIPNNAVLLDIGANVGMYSLYAAAINHAEVYAFEPESQNYSLLNKNIYANHLSERVHAFCAGISDCDGLDSLYLSNFELGSSCHSMGEEVGFDLQPRKSPYTQGAVSFSVDSLVEKGLIPVPDFIKIDVDGFEHKVISGAIKTLFNPKVQSVIIELNPHLSEHLDVVEQLKKLGFEFDQAQVDKAARSDGAFKDVGEWIFYRKQQSNHATHTLIPSVVNIDKKAKNFATELVSRIKQSEIHESPFPHVIVDNIFPEEYYQQILKFFPTKQQMASIAESGRTAGAYPDRFVTLFKYEDFQRLNEAQKQFWGDFGGWLYSPEFINGIIDMMWPYVQERMGEIPKPLGSTRVSGDALLVNDQTNYGIGPHTDLPQRLITFLFYFPEDDQKKHLGTSIYQPNAGGFSCAEGKHYPRDNFTEIERVDFVPNRMLMFVRNNQSFHGVEKILQENIERKLLINNIRLIDA